jgi:hypothetical protein
MGKKDRTMKRKEGTRKQGTERRKNKMNENKEGGMYEIEKVKRRKQERREK